MNYQAHYDKLIARGQSRTLPVETYKEIHHILPRCNGGSDDSSNLVALLPEEHLVAHLLLARISPEIDGYVHAAAYMTAMKKNNNKKYGWLQRMNAEVKRKQMLDRWSDLEYREKTIAFLNSESIRKIQKEAAIANWNNEDFRERKTKATSTQATRQWSNPEFRKKMTMVCSEAAKKKWETVEYKEKALIRLEQVRQSIDVEKISEMARVQVTEQWKDLDYRKKQARARGIPVYQVTDPEGKIHIIENGICDFAQANGLGKETFQKMIKGWTPTQRSPAVGWKVEVIG